MGVTSTDKYAKKDYEAGDLFVYLGSGLDFHVIQLLHRDQSYYIVKYLYSQSIKIGTIDEDFSGSLMRQLTPINEVTNPKEVIRRMFKP